MQRLDVIVFFLIHLYAHTHLHICMHGIINSINEFKIPENVYIYQGSMVEFFCYYNTFLIRFLACSESKEKKLSDIALVHM